MTKLLENPEEAVFSIDKDVSEVKVDARRMQKSRSGIMTVRKSGLIGGDVGGLTIRKQGNRYDDPVGLILPVSRKWEVHVGRNADDFSYTLKDELLHLFFGWKYPEYQGQHHKAYMKEFKKTCGEPFREGHPQ